MDDFEMVRSAVQKNGQALIYASMRFQNHFEIVKTAVSLDGTALEYAPEELQNDFNSYSEKLLDEAEKALAQSKVKRIPF